MILDSKIHCEYFKFMSIASLNNAALFDWQLLNNIQVELAIRKSKQQNYLNYKNVFWNHKNIEQLFKINLFV